MDDKVDEVDELDEMDELDELDEHSACLVTAWLHP
jgi:hypothetical protein